jgi:hypothetical protein
MVSKMRNKNAQPWMFGSMRLARRPSQLSQPVQAKFDRPPLRPSRLIEDGAILQGRTTGQTGSGDGVEHPQTSRGLRPRWARSHCVISVATFEPLCRSG